MTSDQLRQVLPEMPKPRAEEITDLINRVLPLYNIVTGQQIAVFLAQVIHESGGFMHKEEDLNYSVAGLKATFKYFRDNPGQANLYGRKSATKPANKSMIANIAYQNRMGNGPSSTGDGFRFRGGGFIQITGKDMYSKYAAYTGMPIDAISYAVKNNDIDAMDSAAWLFTNEKKLLALAGAGLIDKVSRAINGGDNGLEERRELYVKIKKAINVK